MKTLLFDLDGTLIDSGRDLANSVNHALVSIGQSEMNQEKILSFVGNGLKRLIEETVGNVGEEKFSFAINTFREHYHQNCVQYTKPYPEVSSGLKKFRGTWAMGVITNKPLEFAQKILRSLELEPNFGVIFGGDTFPERKPDPKPLLEAMGKLGSDPSQTIIIGDGLQDVEAGKKAGVKTCVATYGFGYRKEVLDEKPDYVIDHFSQLEEILK